MSDVRVSTTQGRLAERRRKESIQLTVMRCENARLRAEVDRLRRENAQLRSEVDRLGREVEYWNDRLREV
jgi:predicted RNase H-like nuclease (RuvC/YqgF family)